ncbi:hypothetical protein C0J52_23070 [Blattella germanica]|nr:hypothetical protein C0J52_23070 [Blattella germanica]
MEISSVFLSTLAFSFDGIHPHFFIILLQGSKILSSFRELTLFHAFAYIPVDKCSLSIHQIKFVIQTSPSFSDGSSIGQHAHSSLNFGQISSWYDRRRLVVNSNLKASGAPIHKLNGPLGFDGSYGCVDVFGHNISTVQHAASHVLPMTGVAFYHLIGWFEASIGLGVFLLKEGHQLVEIAFVTAHLLRCNHVSRNSRVLDTNLRLVISYLVICLFQNDNWRCPRQIQPKVNSYGIIVFSPSKAPEVKNLPYDAFKRRVRAALLAAALYKVEDFYHFALTH